MVGPWSEIDAYLHVDLRIHPIPSHPSALAAPGRGPAAHLEDATPSRSDLG